MSIKKKPGKYIINSITADTLVITGDSVQIQGPGIAIPPFLSTDVVDCYRTCPSACTPRVVTVTPAVPETPCDCPYVWKITAKPIACRQGYLGDDASQFKFLQFEAHIPTGQTPDVNDIVVMMVEYFNNDPYGFLTAAAVGSPGSYTAFTLTEKECDSEEAGKTCGFTVVTSGGPSEVSEDTAHVDAILTPEDAYRAFPIQHGAFGTNPDLTNCGSYCKYYFKIRPSTPNLEAHMAANAYVTREIEYEFWVNQDDANFFDDWNNELAAEFDCIDELS